MGMSGSAVGNTDEVYFGINKADVWDKRYDSDVREILVDAKCLEMLIKRAPKTLQALNQESCAAASKGLSPTPKRCGALVIRTPWSKEIHGQGPTLRGDRLSLRIRNRTAKDHRNVHSFVHKDQNLLVVRMRFASEGPIVRMIELLRPPDQCNTGIADATAFVERQDFGIEQHIPPHKLFPEDFYYVLRGRILGAIRSAEG